MELRRGSSGARANPTPVLPSQTPPPQAASERRNVSIHDLLFNDTGSAAEGAAGGAAVPSNTPHQWGQTFIEATPSLAAPVTEKYSFIPDIRGRQGPSVVGTGTPGGMMDGIISPVSMPALVINQPACTDCRKQPQTIVVQPPPTAPYAVLPGSGAPVYVIVVSSPMARLSAADAAPAASSYGLGAVHGGGGGGLPDVGSACLCGPECQCVGCVMHPFNDATEQYVRSAFSGGTAGSSPRASGEDNAAALTSATAAAGAGWKHIAPADDFFFLDFPSAADMDALGGLGTVEEGAVEVVEDALRG